MTSNIKFFNLKDEDIQKLQDRFWRYVVIPENLNECWIWVGAKAESGYGVINFIKGRCYSHRISFWLYKQFCQGYLLGKSKILVRHSCNNPSCVNPTHLNIGNHKDNRQDWARKLTHCKHGHELTPENTYIYKTGKRSCKTCIRILHKLRDRAIFSKGRIEIKL